VLRGSSGCCSARAAQLRRRGVRVPPARRPLAARTAPGATGGGDPAMRARRGRGRCGRVCPRGRGCAAPCIYGHGPGVGRCPACCAPSDPPSRHAPASPALPAGTMSSLKLLNQDAEHAKRFVALAMNINAAKGLQEVLKTNLGPKVSEPLRVLAPGVVQQESLAARPPLWASGAPPRSNPALQMRSHARATRLPACAARRAEGGARPGRGAFPLTYVLRRARSRCWSEARATSS